jgi:hypothetical protein
MAAASNTTSEQPPAEANVEAVRPRWLEEILAAQGANGGFRQAAGRPQNTEATALAILALAAAGADRERIESARNWLRAQQRSDGGWPLFEGIDQGSWATAWALLALHNDEKDRERLRRGAGWLVRREGRTVGGLAWLVFWLTPTAESADIDPTLVGWPWHDDSFSWVEPTAVALLALKKLRTDLGTSFPGKRVGEGERVLYDRECTEGGWNYGNRAVLGENLPPYPDSTAIALIALQDQPPARNDRSLQALRRLVDDPHSSGLALALGAICLSLYGADAESWRRRLVDTYNRSRFLGETRTLSLALLATGDPSALRVT